MNPSRDMPNRTKYMCLKVKHIKDISLAKSIPCGEKKSAKCSTLKPDFHSRFSLVDNDNFRMGDAQSGETNRTGRKNIFCSVRIWSSNISTTAKFFYSETNFLSHVEITRGSKNITKWPSHRFMRPKLKRDRPRYILKTRVIELQTSFRLRQFFAGTLRK